jgi:ribA/ribD-fused uncharacterized protein
MRSVEEVVAAMAAGRRLKFLPFWGHTPRGEQPGPWYLSQWYASPFQVDGVHYATAEHYMMAGKASLFGDDAMVPRILAASSPGEAKALGRQVAGFDGEVWAAHRFDIVVAGSVGKFAHHEALRAYLLATNERVLVEASPRDRIWGIGLAATNPDATVPSRWRGLNLLGFALMEARAQLGNRA